MARSTIKLTLAVLLNKLNRTAGRATLQPPLAYRVIEFGRLLVGRADKNQEHGSTRTKNKSDRAAVRIGVVGITSASKSREWALSGGGALSGFPSVGGINSGHEPSVRPRVAVGPLGLFDHVGVRLARPGSPARRRVSGGSRECRARSTPRGCSTHVPSFVRACRCLGSLDSSRTPC
jgi:hypothetical protein